MNMRDEWRPKSTAPVEEAQQGPAPAVPAEQPIGEVPLESFVQKAQQGDASAPTTEQPTEDPKTGPNLSTHNVPGASSSQSHTPLSNYRASFSSKSHVHNSFFVLSEHDEDPMQMEEADQITNDKENIPPKRSRKPSHRMSEVLESIVGGQAKANKPATKETNLSGSKRK